MLEVSSGECLVFRLDQEGKILILISTRICRSLNILMELSDCTFEIDESKAFCFMKKTSSNRCI